MGNRHEGERGGDSFKRRLMRKFLIDATLCALQSRQEADLLLPETLEPFRHEGETLLLENVIESRKGRPGVDEHLRGILGKIRKSKTIRIQRVHKAMAKKMATTESNLFSWADSINPNSTNVGESERVTISPNSRSYEDASEHLMDDFRMRIECPLEGVQNPLSPNNKIQLVDSCLGGDSLDLDCTSLEGDGIDQSVKRQPCSGMLDSSAADKDTLRLSEAETGDMEASSPSADICRVCRGEATTQQPLFYPCLCSGSIKYVHQECLFEWLKHSKKKYCELCQHPFSFSPVYQPQMPSKLPISVVLRGISRQVYRFGAFVLRWAFLTAVWAIALPLLSTASVAMSFSWDIHGILTGDLGVIFFSLGAGYFMTALMVIVVMGMLLLKDYMSSHNLLRIRLPRRRHQNAPMPATTTTTGTTAGFALSESTVMHVGVAEPAISEVETMMPAEGSEYQESTGVSVTSRVPEKSLWLQNVSPREYRAYLRRKELYKARSFRTEEARLNSVNVLQENDVQLGSDAYSEQVEALSESNAASGSVANASLITPLVDSECLGTIDSSHASPSGDRPLTHYNMGRDGSRGEGSHPFVGAASSSSNVTFSDNIRCKVCSSVVCVNKEHVTRASTKPRLTEQNDASLARSRLAAQQDVLANEALPEPSLDQEQLLAAPQAPIRPPQQHQHQQPLLPPVDGEEDGLNFLNINLDGDNNGGMTLSEFFGIKGSAISAIHNAFVLCTCNFLIIQLFVVLPNSIGAFLLKGGALKYYSSLSSHVQSVLSEATAFPSLDLAWCISSLDHMKHYSSQVSAIAMTNPHLSSLLAQTYVLWSSTCNLVAYDSGAIVDFIVQALVGYTVLFAVHRAYRFVMINSVDSLGKAQKSSLQLLMVVEAFLRMFMVLGIELVVFPIFCGWVIDWSTLPLFNSSIAKRMAFYNSYPFLSHMIHWAIGTCILIQISLLFKWLRDVFRPGLLYFIRNSSDPDNMLVREIVERPMMVQLLRFASSAVFYLVILVSHFYGFSLFCQKFVPNLVPLNFDFRTSITHLPLDLLGNLLIRMLCDVFDPSLLGTVVRDVIRVAARVLKLSSYLFGGRFLSEEKLSSGRWVFLPSANRIYRAEKIRAMFRRSPEPIDIASIPVVEGRETSQVRLAEFQTAPRRPTGRTSGGGRRSEESTKGFTVVYRPNQCRVRFLIFLGIMWLTALSLGLILIAAPILIGRYVLSIFLPVGDKAPELQTFEVGFLLLGFMMKATHAIYAFTYQKGIAQTIRSTLHAPTIFFKAFFIFSTTCIAWPTAIGFYLMLTLSPLLSSLNETAVIPVFTCWFLGFVYGRFFYSMRRHICSEQRNRIMDRLSTWEGWYDPHFKDVCLGFLLPYSLRLCTMILGPPLAVLLLCPIIDLSFVQILMLQRWSYCLSLAVPTLIFVVWLLMRLRVRLLMRIRDENYLVGRRLHNLERPPNSVVPAIDDALQ